MVRTAEPSGIASFPDIIVTPGTWTGAQTDTLDGSHLRPKAKKMPLTLQSEARPRRVATAAPATPATGGLGSHFMPASPSEAPYRLL